MAIKWSEPVERAVKRVARYFEWRQDDQGRELNTGIPVAPPIGYTSAPSMIDIVRQQIRGEHLRIAALQAGQETFEEADDFDVGDDMDPTSPFEEVFDPVDYEVRNRLRNQEFETMVRSRLNPEPVNGDGNGERSGVRESGEGPAGGGHGNEVSVSRSGSEQIQQASVQGGVRDRIEGNPRPVGEGKSG